MKIHSVKETLDELAENTKQDYIYIHGILNYEFEGDCIAHWPKSERTGDEYKDSIYISPALNFKFEDQTMKRWSGKRVIVGGKLYGPSEGFDGCGHMSLWPAELAVTQVELYENHFNEKT